MGGLSKVEKEKYLTADQWHTYLRAPRSIDPKYATHSILIGVG
jgi:hypothetical protein